MLIIIERFQSTTFTRCWLLTQICTDELLPLHNRYTLKQQNTITQQRMAACIDCPNIYWNFISITHTHIQCYISKQQTIFTFYAQQQQQKKLCSADSLAHKSTRQKDRLWCERNKRKRNNKEGKQKLGQKQLKSQISGSVNAGAACSWGSGAGSGGRALFCSQTTKTPLLRLHFFCISSAWRCRSRLGNYPLIEYS